MLARANRLTARADFIETVRKGRCAHAGALTGFIFNDSTKSEPRFGFQVSRRVGGSVDRHRVVRQLRHLIAPWVVKTPMSAMVVIRPDRKVSNYSEDVDLLMKRLIERDLSA